MKLEFSIAADWGLVVRSPHPTSAPDPAGSNASTPSKHKSNNSKPTIENYAAKSLASRAKKPPHGIEPIDSTATSPKVHRPLENAASSLGEPVPNAASEASCPSAKNSMNCQKTSRYPPEDTDAT